MERAVDLFVYQKGKTLGEKSVAGIRGRKTTHRRGVAIRWAKQLIQIISLSGIKLQAVAVLIDALFRPDMPRSGGCADDGE
jgi:hypothetical protein